MQNRTDILKTALVNKIKEIDVLEQELDRDRCKTFYLTTARLIEEIEGGESNELNEFRTLSGYSAVHGSDEAKNQEWDTKSYYSHLKTARSILTAILESLDWRGDLPNSIESNSTTESTNTWDNIRQAVLDMLYDEQRRHPQRIAGWTANEISFRLRDINRADVGLAVEFLEGAGLLKAISDKSVKRYRLSSKAINRYQPSKFQNKPFSSFQISGQNNIVVMGDNLGDIEQKNTDGISDIDSLISLINNSKISQQLKIDAVSDLETIKAQLIKQKPDKSIVSKAWEGAQLTLNATSKIAAVSDSIEKVSHFISTLVK